MICCLASAACPLRDTAAPLAACGGREGIRAVYDAGIDLGHYGEVDQLAPAGAMAEFTAYVRRQSEEEAEAAFAPLRQAARSRGVEMRLHVVYGPSAVRDLLRRWGEEENVRVFGGEGMSLACLPAASRAMPQRPATGSGKERRFPSRFFPCEKAVTEDTQQRRKGAGHDYPDMRHAACCSGAQSVRMKARMGIGKPPVTPGTVPRTGQRQDEGKDGERRRKSGKARPMEGTRRTAIRRRASGKSP